MNRCCATAIAAFAFCSSLVCHATAQEADGEQGAKKTIRIFDSLTLTVPDDWEKQPVRSRILEHEFVAPVDDGDDDAPAARVTMMAAGGDVEANIERWKAQFSGGAAAKVDRLDVAGSKVHLVELEGSFKEPTGGGPFAGGKTVVRENYGMLGAIIVVDDGRKYFVKMTGPREAIAANRKAFHTMMKGLES